MRRQYRSFIVTMAVVSICCSFIGCKSNGGSWYKPSSYSWHNPFKNNASFEDDEFGQLAEENNSGIRMPKDGQTPDLDLTTPAGGYSRDQVAQNPGRSTNFNVPAAGGSGYSYSQQNQNPSVAMNAPANQNQNTNQQVNWQNPNQQGNWPSSANVSPGQTAMQGQYQSNQYQPPNQYQAPNQQYSGNYNNGTQGSTAPVPNSPYPPYNNSNGSYSAPTPGQYDYGTASQTQTPSGYSTGQNSYHNEYSPGNSRL